MSRLGDASRSSGISKREANKKKMKEERGRRGERRMDNDDDDGERCVAARERRLSNRATSWPGFLVRTTTRVSIGVRRGQHRWPVLEASYVPIFGSVAYRAADVISGVATPSSLSRSSAARRFTTHPHEKLK